MDERVRQAISEGTDSVHLVVPPSSEYLRTARLVAADAAVRAGLDCEEIEDFRIAVDELCHLVMTSTDHFIDLWVVAADDRVIAHGRAPSRSGAAARIRSVWRDNSCDISATGTRRCVIKARASSI